MASEEALKIAEGETLQKLDSLRVSGGDEDHKKKSTKPQQQQQQQQQQDSTKGNPKRQWIPLDPKDQPAVQSYRAIQTRGSGLHVQRRIRPSTETTSTTTAATATAPASSTATTTPATTVLAAAAAPTTNVEGAEKPKRRLNKTHPQSAATAAPAAAVAATTQQQQATSTTTASTANVEQNQQQEGYGYQKGARKTGAKGGQRRNGFPQQQQQQQAPQQQQEGGVYYGQTATGGFDYYAPQYDREAVRSFLQQKLEFFLTRDHMVCDYFLRRNMDDAGFVPLSVFAGFRSIAAALTDAAVLVEAAQQSSSLELVDNKIRTKLYDPRDLVLPAELRIAH